MKDWWIYKGTGVPHNGIVDLPEPPSWRKFGDAVPGSSYVKLHTTEEDMKRLQAKAEGFQVDDDEIDIINAALLLRRPLLVTGKPGSGKSTLAYAVAYELNLGSVLHWPITTRVTLQNGLYHYDAIGRLQQVSLKERGAKDVLSDDIGEYLRLGPLGTALLPSKHPQVLLIDEIDKSDIDLPNDLLNVFEEGEYKIPELTRISKWSEQVPVMPEGTDSNQRVYITAGHVRCAAFPFIVLTSNDERQFPPAFLRRCLRLEIEPPNEEKLTKIVEARLDADVLPLAKELIADFVKRREEGNQATDQLLNAIYLITRPQISPSEIKKLLESVWRPLTSEAMDEN